MYINLQVPINAKLIDGKYEHREFTKYFNLSLVYVGSSNSDNGAFSIISHDIVGACYTIKLAARPQDFRRLNILVDSAKLTLYGFEIEGRLS